VRSDRENLWAHLVHRKREMTRASSTAKTHSSFRQGTGWSHGCIAAGCLSLLAAGWSLREEQYLTPERGPGYALGITGALLMLSILIYSARKRLRWMRGRGAMKHWLRAHLAVGLAGPIAALFHSNFHLGSTNSSVAVLAMLTVAGSGIIGRFLYAQVHHGLYGRQLQLAEIWEDTRKQFGPLRELLASQRELLAELEALQSWTQQRLGQPRLPLTLRARSQTARQLAQQFFAREPEALLGVDHFLGGLQRVARFAICERIFRLWHALHVPLFATLLVTLTAHVIAVHMY